MWRAIWVARSMSLCAPVVIWPKIELLGGAAAEQHRQPILELGLALQRRGPRAGAAS